MKILPNRSPRSSKNICDHMSNSSLLVGVPVSSTRRSIYLKALRNALNRRVLADLKLDAASMITMSQGQSSRKPSTNQDINSRLTMWMSERSSRKHARRPCGAPLTMR